MDTISQTKRKLAERLEQKARQAFCLLRWPSTGDQPICPKCGFRERIYWIAAVPGKRAARFKCAFCKSQFTPTSATSLSSAHISYAQLMIAIEALQEKPELAIKALAALIGVSAKSAFVLRHKLRLLNGRFDNNEQANAWKGYSQKPRRGRLVGPRGRRDGQRRVT